VFYYNRHLKKPLFSEYKQSPKAVFPYRFCAHEGTSGNVVEKLPYFIVAFFQRKDGEHLEG
jgi:hypothetical protein